MEIPQEIIVEIGKVDWFAWRRLRLCNKALKRELDIIDPITFTRKTVNHYRYAIVIEWRTSDGLLFKKVLRYKHAGVAEYSTRSGKGGIFHLVDDQWLEYDVHVNKLSKASNMHEVLKMLFAPINPSEQ